MSASVNHEAVRKELDRLTRDGVLLPQDVLNAARSEVSPLHGCFTWDDSEAAEKWRLEEARRLIRVYVVMAEPSNVETRAFVSLTTDRSSGGGYRPIDSILSDRALYDRMLQDAIKELQSINAKYKRISELDPVFAAVEKVAKREIRKAA